MNWLFIATFAHCLNALVFVVDKHILSRSKLAPAGYAFYVGFLGLFALLLIPFGFSFTTPALFSLAFFAGASFTMAILFFYQSIKWSEVSRITPIVGGATPLFTILFSYLFLKESLAFYQLIAFSLLVLGSIVILWPRKHLRENDSSKPSLARRLPMALLSGFFFAASFVLSKYLFGEMGFINGFIWIRMGGVLGALFLLLHKKSRKIILGGLRQVKTSTRLIALANKGLSASSFLLLNYAISLGRVSLVNALQGVQYVFLLTLAQFLSRRFPAILKEQATSGALAQKIIGIFLIGFGLGILAL